MRDDGRVVISWYKLGWYIMLVLSDSDGSAHHQVKTPSSLLYIKAHHRLTNISPPTVCGQLAWELWLWFWYCQVSQTNTRPTTTCLHGSSGNELTTSSIGRACQQTFPIYCFLFLREQPFDLEGVEDVPIFCFSIPPHQKKDLSSVALTNIHAKNDETK